MSVVTTLIVAAAALALGLVLAYLPMRILLTQMGKRITAPIRAFIQRQRDRRAIARQSPDRRTNTG